MVMGSTPSCGSLMVELHGEDTACWEQVLQQTQDWQLLEPGNTEGDVLELCVFNEADN